MGLDAKHWLARDRPHELPSLRYVEVEGIVNVRQLGFAPSARDGIFVAMSRRAADGGVRVGRSTIIAKSTAISARQVFEKRSIVASGMSIPGLGERFLAVAN